jgi:hypothetical protein
LPQTDHRTKPGQDRGSRLRRAGFRSVGVATAGAFAGGVLVVGLQIAFSMVSARYPPIVQSVSCEVAAPDGPPAALSEAMSEVATGAVVSCRIDAPGADYAAWSLTGPALQVRSGSLDADMDCQSEKDFGGQSADALRVSGCQSFTLANPGQHRLVVKVMARGLATVDRAELLLRARTPPPPPPAGPASLVLRPTLLLPAVTAEQERRIAVSETLREHKLWPTNRDYSRVVYRLAAEETHVASSIQVSSAESASGMRVAYVAVSRAVALSFRLRSGPLIDPWRGWLSGTVLVQVKREEPAAEGAMAEQELPLPGLVSVPLPPEVQGRTPSAVRLAGAAGSVEVAPGGAATLGGMTVAARLDGKALVIEATPPPAE